MRIMRVDEAEAQNTEIRQAVRKLCADFPGAYWRSLDRDRAPVRVCPGARDGGILSVLIPEAYGGSGLGLSAAAAILEEIHRSGCDGGAWHAQMYTIGTIGKRQRGAEVALTFRRSPAASCLETARCLAVVPRKTVPL
jgi:alkylation response protein AidB-like acyl-CoA dehydrogenase